MCKVAFNHFFLLRRETMRRQRLGLLPRCSPPPPPSPLAVQTLDTRRHLGEPRLKRIRQNLLLFIATRLGCLPPSLELCDFGELSATPPSTNSLSHSPPPSLLAFALALWAFALLYSRLFDFSQLCLQLICCCCSTVVLVVVVVVA